MRYLLLIRLYYYTGGNNYTSYVAQSTTGNVYGIYDINGGAINGGAWEYTAAGFTSNVTSTFESLTGFDEKYVNRYNGSSSDRTANYSANSGKYGDAVYETSNVGNSGSGAWNSQRSYFLDMGGPFFGRNMFAFDTYGSGHACYFIRFPSGYCCIVLGLEFYVNKAKGYSF